MKRNSNLFNFVHDRTYKSILEGDYNELHTCLSASCHKSAVVLAGSIIECLALHCSQSLNFWPDGKADILKAGLSDLIDELRAAQIISQKAKDLSSVVRYYRNLIHPGKLIRLKEKADAESAEIAASLVNLIASEVSASFTARHGLAADQVMEKLRIDPSSSDLARHHLKEVSDAEIGRLVADFIPNALVELSRQEYVSSDEAEWQDRYEEALCTTFRVCCSQVESATKAFAEYYIRSLRFGSESFIAVLDKHLFDGMFLRHFSLDDLGLTKDHWIARIASKSIFAYERAINSFSFHADADYSVDVFLALYAAYERERIKETKQALYKICLEAVPFDVGMRKNFEAQLRRTYLKVFPGLIDKFLKEAEEHSPF